MTATEHFQHRSRRTPEELQRLHGERVEARQREHAQERKPDPLNALLDALDAEARAGRRLGYQRLNTRRNAEQALGELFATVALLDILGQLGVEDDQDTDQDDSYDQDTDQDAAGSIAADSGTLLKPPFDAYWDKLNANRASIGAPPVSYEVAREQFTGGATPVGTLTFVGKEWDGIRAVPTPPIATLGGQAQQYHGEYRVEKSDGSLLWYTVMRGGQPIIYNRPDAALRAAREYIK